MRLVIWYLHTGVGFGVARFDNQAMPEPLNVGRVTGRLPRFFFVYQQIFFTWNPTWLGGP
jgi:hypothetical protein